jgi:signal transduction histidine kinase
MPETAHKKVMGSPSRRRVKGGFWTGSLMAIAILTIIGFQAYWLKNNYDREKENLKITTNSSFRETVFKLQSTKLKLEKVTFQLDTIRVTGTHSNKKPLRIPLKGGEKFTSETTPHKDKESVITIMNLLQQKLLDSLGASPDSIKKGIIALNASRGHSFSRDSLRVIRNNVDGKSIPALIMPVIDTLVKSPDEIRSITINGKDKSNRVVSISYSNEIKEEDAPEPPGPARPGRFTVKRQIPDSIKEFTATGKVDVEKIDDPMRHFLFKMDSMFVKDSVTILDITTAYSKRLKEDNISVPFTVERLDSMQEKSPDAVTIGFTKPVTFELSLGSTFTYMLGKLKLPILFSLLLIGLTIAAFFLLYRNMMKQQRLAEMRNDLISNISHELKTPIATVGVALEALKSFNAMHDPVRTKEYLDISQNELQRLNLLVDKVLKLSIFEKKAIELKKEQFDYKQLTEEIMNSMRLQFEKYHAKVSLHTEGESFHINADKLHITSVIYNLLDNALKYSRENPVIQVQLKSTGGFIELSVEENGIGIPDEYKAKIFEKFFRVPTGDKHNIKGYGLGLSYVAEVVKRHKGEITVESETGKGSTFTVKLPVSG